MGNIDIDNEPGKGVDIEGGSAADRAVPYPGIVEKVGIVLYVDSMGVEFAYENRGGDDAYDITGRDNWGAI